jgi:hypothetical protein
VAWRFIPQRVSSMASSCRKGKGMEGRYVIWAGARVRRWGNKSVVSGGCADTPS